MSFTDLKDKILFKIFAPSTLCHRGLGIEQHEFKFWSGLPVCVVFSDEPYDKDGFCKTVYINNQRVKWWQIIPRHAFIEVRHKPTGIIATIIGAVAAALGVSTVAAGVIVGVAAGIAVGVAAGVTLGVTLGGRGAGVTNGQNMPTYSSKNTPDLSGAKNEVQEGVVPIAFGRILQTFNFGQYCYPLVKSGYGGNRYRTYFVAGYKNARYEKFRLGDVLLENYRQASYSLQQANGQSGFIGWDNAFTYSYERELTFDKTQAVFQTAIAYFNQPIVSTLLEPADHYTLTQKYVFHNVNYNYWTNKRFRVGMTLVFDNVDMTITKDITITRDMLYQIEGEQGSTTYYADVNIDVTAEDFGEDTEGKVVEEYRYTTTEPSGQTRGNSYENELTATLVDETLTFSEIQIYTVEVGQGVDSYSGDRNEIISQSVHDCRFCDMHFAFPKGLYRLNRSSGNRERTTISCEIVWKSVDENTWRHVDDSMIERIYTRNLDGVIENLSSRISRNGDIFTFATPAAIDDADDNFYEAVGLQFKEAGQYQVRVLPVVFDKDDYFVGNIYLNIVTWRLKEGIDVINPDILPNVSQIACTFNATTQLDGEIDKFAAICRPYIKNIATGEQEQSRNPVDVIYYLLTDEISNPDPMSEDQIDMDSFLKARQWCEEHDCKCDGIISEEIKYEKIINEIASNNQLYFIPNKWGKAVIRVDTNEDNRPIKTMFNAENSWDLKITRVRGKYGRTLAIRGSYVDENTWADAEITGYWYDGECHWQPEAGKDDTYYQPETRNFSYVKNENDVKRRIAYELEIMNVKNVSATFKVAREVLDLEVLDRVLVADYTRINDGVSGNIESLLYNDDKTEVIGFKTSSPFIVTEGMTMTVRSVDTSGGGQNINTYRLKLNEKRASYIILENSIKAHECIVRGSGFYNIDGMDFYHSGDLYMAGTADILSMVISNIDEVDGEQFTSSITCRLY